MLRNCEKCGAGFQTTEWHIKRGWGRTCSRACKASLQSTTHGSSLTPTYKTWEKMRARCNNPNQNGYENYGGRGIRICDRWNDFKNFLADMGERPNGCSLDRIDSNGNYEPNNCRWATRREQAMNRRTNVVVSYRGREMCLMELAAELGLEFKTISYRVRNWPEERWNEPLTQCGPRYPKAA